MQMWGSGNIVDPEQSGCVFANEQRHVDANHVPVFADYWTTEIGCCDDYAYMLMALLRLDGIQARAAVAGGHVVVEAKLDGKPWVLDGNTGVAYSASWDQINRASGPIDLIMLSPFSADPTRRDIYRANYWTDQARIIITTLRGGYRTTMRDSLPPQYYGDSSLRIGS
jgi:hypothetical protein